MAWCQAVINCVRFKPDRPAIKKELAAHYEDHVRDLERIGFDWKLAQERALASGQEREQKWGRSLWCHIRCKIWRCPGALSHTRDKKAFSFGKKYFKWKNTNFENKDFFLNFNEFRV